MIVSSFKTIIDLLLLLLLLLSLGDGQVASDEGVGNPFLLGSYNFFLATVASMGERKHKECISHCISGNHASFVAILECFGVTNNREELVDSLERLSFQLLREIGFFARSVRQSSDLCFTEDELRQLYHFFSGPKWEEEDVEKEKEVEEVGKVDSDGAVPQEGARPDQVLKILSVNGRTFRIVSHTRGFATGKKANSGRPLDKFPFLLDHMIHHGMKIACLQEVRICGSGILERTDLLTGKGFSIFFSGHEAKGVNGVAIVLDDSLVSKIGLDDKGEREIHFVSDRLIWIAGRFEGMDVAIFSVYFPTNDYSEVEKERFYETFQETFDSVPKKYRRKIVMGDFNARIGQDRERVFQDCRGLFNINDGINDNGLRLMGLCSRNKLFVANTLKKVKSGRVGTWKHIPSGKWFTLDHCLVSDGLLKQVKECTLAESVNVWSDHIAIQLTLTAKIPPKRFFPTPKVKPFEPDFSLLKQSSSLCSGFGKILDSEIRLARCTKDPKDSSFAELNDIIHFCANNIIPSKISNQRRHQDWFDSDNLEIRELLEARTDAHNKHLANPLNAEFKEEFKHVRAKAQRELRQMQDKYWPRHCDTIEDLAESGNAREYFKACKLMFGKHSYSKDKKAVFKLDGKLTKNPVEYLARLAEHSTNLLNQPSVVSSKIGNYLQEQQPEIAGLDDDFTMKELLTAILAMNSDRAMGVDKTPIELYCWAESEELQREVLNLFNRQLRSGVVENLVKDVIVTFLFKKGCPFDCNNYRTLSLIAHIGKALERMILNRLDIAAEKFELGFLPESQNGFRRNRGTVDSLFAARMVGSLCREKGVDCFHAFVDLTKAYDKVPREILWLVLKTLGVPERLIALIKAIHVGSMASVKDGKALSEAFELLVGLKQGSVFAPILFNIFFGAIIFAIRKRIDLEKLGIKLACRFKTDPLNTDRKLLHENKVDYVAVLEFLFADDAVFNSVSEEGLQEIMSVVEEVCVAFGMLIATAKTEIMVVRARLRKNSTVQATRVPSIVVGGVTLKNVDQFKYVGSHLNSVAKLTDKSKLKSGDKKSKLTGELAVRHGKMVVAFEKLSKSVFENPRLKLSERLRLFRVFVISSGTFGCETWNLTKVEMRKLETEYFRLLKRIFGYKWYHKKSYTTILEECKLVGVTLIPLEAHIRKQRLSYFGHIMRMDQRRLPKIILFAELEAGSRLQGGQEISYKACIKSDLKAFGISQIFAEWSALANTRDEWRKVIKGTGLNHFIVSWKAEKNLMAEIRMKNKRSEEIEDETESNEEDANSTKLYRIASAIIRRERALVAGHIVVNRGVNEGKKTSRRGPPVIVNISYARKRLNQIIEDEAGEEVRRGEMEKEDIFSRSVKNIVHDDRTWLDQKYGIGSSSDLEFPIVTINKNGRIFTIPNVKRVVAI